MLVYPEHRGNLGAFFVFRGKSCESGNCHLYRWNLLKRLPQLVEGRFHDSPEVVADMACPLCARHG